MHRVRNCWQGLKLETRVGNLRRTLDLFGGHVINLTSRETSGAWAVTVNFGSMSKYICAHACWGYLSTGSWEKRQRPTGRILQDAVIEIDEPLDVSAVTLAVQLLQNRVAVHFRCCVGPNCSPL